MTEDTDNVDMANEDGGVFTVLSGMLLADDSGDQPLCLFFGGPAFAWGPGWKSKIIYTYISIKLSAHNVYKLAHKQLVFFIFISVFLTSVICMYVFIYSLLGLFSSNTYEPPFVI